MDTPFGTLDQGLWTFSKYKLEYFRFLQLLHAGICHSKSVFLAGSLGDLLSCRLTPLGRPRPRKASFHGRHAENGSAPSFLKQTKKIRMVENTC